MKDDPFYSASNMEHELIEDDGQEYARGQLVRFTRGDEELTGEVVVVDDRHRECDTYGCGWTYDILVDDYQGAPCVFKHVPQHKVLGVKL